MSRPRSLRAGAIVAAVGLAGPALAQEGQRPFITVEHEGLSSLFVDPRDMPLRDALAMVPERVGELPGEIPDMPEEAAELLQVVLGTIAKPARLAIVYDGDDVSGGFYGYGFLASVECDDDEDAEEIDDAVSALLDKIAEEQGAEIPLEESDRFEGMRELMLPLGLVSFGPRESDEGVRYELIIGNVHDADAPFADPPSIIDAPGFESVATATADFTVLTPLSKMAVGFAGENAAEVRDVVSQIEALGLVGEEAMRVEYEAGYTEQAAVQRWVMRGAAPRAEALSLPTEPLDEAALRAVPADALGAVISSVSFASINGMIEEAAARGLPVEEGLAEFEAETGVDLVEDVFNALGGAAALYCADSTGGGSLLSTVAMVAVQDHERFAGALEKLTDFANDKIDESGQPGDYIQLRGWSVDEGAKLLSLQFPGLPVPVEVTLALTEDWFIAALTPQAAAAAARQTLGMGDDGLPSNPRFASMFEEHGEGATGLSFVDSARTIRDGYAILSLASSAISNLVRSPGDPGEREPGMLLPLYRDLVNDDVRPTMKITRWEGDDLVTTTWSDRCLWVQAGGEAGVASVALPLVAGAIAAGALAGQQQMMGDIGGPDFSHHALGAVRHTLMVDPVRDAATLFFTAATLQPEAALPAEWPGGSR